MSSFVNMRSTIVKIKASVRAKLSPKPLEDINFDLKDFLSYTKTKKDKQFLRYDNKDNRSKKRLLIFMSDTGIEWLRESLRIHGDGTFKESAKVKHFNKMN
jgi:hypothetical protein